MASTDVHTLDQEDLSRWRGRSVGIVFQFFQLLPSLTIAENVMLPMDFCNTYPYPRASLRARWTSLHRWVLRIRPTSCRRRSPAANSSAPPLRGPWRMIRPLIVADEPTGNLDSRTAEEVMAVLRAPGDRRKDGGHGDSRAGPRALLCKVDHADGWRNREPRSVAIVMLSPRWRKLRGDIEQAKGRLLMMIIAIAAGVFAVASISTAYTILKREIVRNYLSTNPAAALFYVDVRRSSRYSGGVRAQAGITGAEAAGRLSGRIEVRPNEWLPLLLFVVPDFRDAHISTARLEAGRWPTAPDGIVLERTAVSVANTAH